MVDTLRGDFKDEECNDCGELGCLIKHYGDAVPKGETGYFCAFCWHNRKDIMDKNYREPLGVKPPGVPKEFRNKPIKVVTEKGSVYKFSKPNKEGRRTVTRIKRDSEEEIDFTECKIICLAKGEKLFLHPFDRTEPEYHGWWTSPVASIE